MQLIEKIVSKIYDLPCWHVQQGQGSFLTFEFGQPHLKTREAKDTKTLLHKAEESHSRRRVTIRGEWHLWIYDCHWEIYHDTRLAAKSESSSSKIGKALKWLDGQKIINIQINPYSADTVFDFEYGDRLMTRSYEKSEQSPYEQWYLFEPTGNVLAVRDDGKFGYHPVDTLPDKAIWYELKPSLQP